jgi:hypothetical protein
MITPLMQVLPVFKHLNFIWSDRPLRLINHAEPTGTSTHHSGLIGDYNSGPSACALVVQVVNEGDPCNPATVFLGVHRLYM